MSKYENKDICAKCGGKCCRSGGCIIDISQFREFNKENLKELILTGMVTIDWWEGDPRDELEDLRDKGKASEYDIKMLEEYKDIPYVPEAYLIRMKELGEDDIAIGSWGGHCMLHHLYGECPLELEYRPAEAATMIPNPDRTHPDVRVRFKASCSNSDDVTYTKQYIAIRGLPYHDIIESVCEDIYDNYDVKTIKYDKDKSIETYKRIIKPTKYDD
jgi:hypothetical protein